MAFIDKLKEELDRAGKAAHGAFDEGKTRLEAFRTRQLADRAAQALGYAVFRAKQSGADVDTDTYDRLSATLATHDVEASRYETEIEVKRREASGDRAGADTSHAEPATASTASAASTASTASTSGPEAGMGGEAQDVSG